MKENRWGRVHQELRQMFCRTPPHTAPAVLRRIHRYKTWELHCGSWDPMMTSRLLEQGRVHRELATLSTFFSDCHQSMDHKNVLKWLLASFRFEDDDQNEDQVQLLLIVRMLKSVTVTA